jgi:CheY-like chemotaxis protein
LHRCALRGRLPSDIFRTKDGIVLHSKDLCIGCGYCFYACPFGAPQYPQVGNFGSRGKMDKCTYCAGGGGPEAPGSAEEFEKYGSNRLHAVARSLSRLLELWGVGPVPTVDRALSLLRATPDIDFTMLDINLRGEMAFPVAEALMASNVPFAFMTGYGKTVIPGNYGCIAVLQKPYDPEQIAAALCCVLSVHVC